LSVTYLTSVVFSKIIMCNGGYVSRMRGQKLQDQGTISGGAHSPLARAHAGCVRLCWVAA